MNKVVYDLALRAYAEVLRRRLAEVANEGLPMAAADVAVMERAANLAAAVGEATAAADLLQAAASLCADAGNVESSDYAALRRVGVLLDAGDLRAADSALRHLTGPVGDIDTISFAGAGLAEFEAACWPALAPPARLLLLALFWFSAGRLLSALGQYEASTAALTRALNRSRAGSTSEFVPAMRLALAQTQIEAGRLADAEALLAEDAEDDATDPAGNPSREIARMLLTGRLATIQGRYGPALDALERTAARSRSLGLGHASVSTSLDLVQLKILLNQTLASRQLLATLVPAIQHLDDEALTLRASFLGRLARARVQSLARGIGLAPGELWLPPPEEEAGQDAEEPDEFRRSDKQPGSFVALFEDHAMMVHWRLGRSDIAGAAGALEHTAAVFANTDSLLLRARLAALEGLVAYYERHYDDSERRLREAAAVLRDIGARPELWQAVRVLTWARARLGASPDDVAELRGTADALLREMAESLPAVNRAMYLLNKWSATDEARASVVDGLVQLRQRSLSRAPGRLVARVIGFWRLGALLLQLDEDRQAFLTTIADVGPAAASSPGFTSRLRLLWSCPADCVVLAFVALPDRLLIVRRLAWAMDFIVVPVTLPALRALVRDCHEAVHDRAGISRDLEPSPARGREDGASLVDALARLAGTIRLEELLGDLPRTITAVTVVPDDVLHGCPFAALPFEGKFLVERFAVSLSFEVPPRPRCARNKGGTALIRRSVRWHAGRACAAWSLARGGPRAGDARAGGCARSAVVRRAGHARLPA